MKQHHVAREIAVIDPELLLQELRARESRGAGARARYEERRVAAAKLGGDGGIEAVPGLEEFATDDIATTLRDAQRVIYGTDDRQDIYELGDPASLTDAASVVAWSGTPKSATMARHGDAERADAGREAQSLRERAVPRAALDRLLHGFPGGPEPGRHEMSDAATALTTIRTGEIYRGKSSAGVRVRPERLTVSPRSSTPEHVPVS